MSEEAAAMLWSLQEAVERQTLQIGASACGATAVVDVLKALGVEVAPEEAERCVQTRLRRNESPLPDYLLSRSEAGRHHSCSMLTRTWLQPHVLQVSDVLQTLITPPAESLDPLKDSFSVTSGCAFRGSPLEFKVLCFTFNLHFLFFFFINISGL